MAEDKDKWNLDEVNLKKLTSGLLEYDEGVVFDYNMILRRSMITLHNMDYRLKTPKELEKTVDSIKNNLKKYNNEKKINSITTVQELQDFLFSVNLRELRKVAEYYVNIMDIKIKEGYHSNYVNDITQIFVHHDTEELIETYKRKIEEYRKQEEIRKRIDDENKGIAFSPMHPDPRNSGGRRSTRKRKKTIRKKRKNKKRTRRFR
jgi:hypothetical protein